MMPQPAAAEPSAPVYTAPTPEPAYAEPVMPEPVYAEPPAPEPVYAPPEMPEPAPAAARRCAYCGSELEPDAAFCSECGHAV